jgi:hypothetical protein
MRFYEFAVFVRTLDIFNASGGSVPFIIIAAMCLAWFRAAALIRALGGFAIR